LPDLALAQTVTTAIDMVTILMLLFGAWKERAGWLLPKVLLMMCGVMHTLLIVVMWIVSIKHDAVHTTSVLLVGALTIALSLYFWVIVYSYYRLLEERRVVH
ncbi:hypothetical protein L9F63_012789, partial [Diploptera punctata]